MSKVVIEIMGTPKENDILVFNGTCFIPVPKEVFLSQHFAKIERLEKKVDENTANQENVNNAIKKAVKENREVLKVLTKEN